jgi:type IV pilus biogenesis protein CpaD/CtpE
LLSACITEPRAPGARLGDATQSNIAALAARASDLALPRRTAPRDAVRRDAVLAAYRQDGGHLKKESIATVPAMEGGQRQ